MSMPNDKLPRSGFHGTKDNVLPLVADGKLTSSKDQGKKPRYRISESDKTYFTPDETHAWSYANDGLTLANFKNQPRPVVLPVEASEGSNVTKDKNTPLFGDLSLTSDGPLNITAEPEWGPPPQMYGGTVTQPSLSHINWHQFDMPNWVVYRGDSRLLTHKTKPLYSSIDAIMQEAHPHLTTRRDANLIKLGKEKLAAEDPKPVKEDPDQLKLF